MNKEEYLSRKQVLNDQYKLTCLDLSTLKQRYAEHSRKLSKCLYYEKKLIKELLYLLKDYHRRVVELHLRRNLLIKDISDLKIQRNISYQHQKSLGNYIKMKSDFEEWFMKEYNLDDQTRIVWIEKSQTYTPNQADSAYRAWKYHYGND